MQLDIRAVMVATLVDGDDLEQVVRYTARRHVTELSARVFQVTSAYNRRRMLNTSTYVLAVGELVVTVSREMSEAVAETIARACGSDASEHVGLLEQTCAEVAAELLATFVKCAEGRGLANQALITQGEEVQARIAENFAHSARELRLGMANRRTIVGSSDTYNISHSTGVAVGSGRAAIQVGRDNLSQTAGCDVAALLKAVETFREALASIEDLPLENKAELDDVALSLEREAKDRTPQPDRLRRLAKGLAIRVEALAIGTASSLIATYLPAVTGALPR